MVIYCIAAMLATLGKLADSDYSSSVVRESDAEVFSSSGLGMGGAILRLRFVDGSCAGAANTVVSSVGAGLRHRGLGSLQWGGPLHPGQYGCNDLTVAMAVMRSFSFSTWAVWGAVLFCYLYVCGAGAIARTLCDRYAKHSVKLIGGSAVRQNQALIITITTGGGSLQYGGFAAIG